MPESSDTGVRCYLAAFLTATLAALVVDAVLQLALDAVRVSAYGGVPWWITANFIERGRWVAFAGLLWWLGPRLLRAGDGGAIQMPPVTRAEAWRQVAVAIVAMPLVWMVATWMVSAARFTLLGNWDTDGRVFLSPDYYRGLVLDLAPWAMAAAALLAVRRHLE